MVHSFCLFIAGLVPWFTYLLRYAGFLIKQIRHLILAASVRSEDVKSTAESSLEESHKLLQLLSCGILGFSQEYFAVIDAVVDK